ncbi:MAG: beta-lactamase family protein [Bacteroidia bacterium]|jgi:CubicO group peptidase (beta-lactamase class C family)|nr:beta-lactamase family protein [Bacteroidia bacterium]
MKLYFSGLLVVLVLLFCGFIPRKDKKPDTSRLSPKAQSRIDSLFSEFNRKNTPGYAIGVLKGSQVLYSKGYGSANLNYEIPITPNTAFDIASVSKQFTAACIALLILENKLTTETPAALFIPELNKYKDTIRIKHLIYNTSGIADYWRLPRPDGKTWITFNYFDIDYAIRVSLSSDTLLFKPETKWDYCNTNYMLLTKIVEKVSGLTFREFSRQKLFEPLGMQHTLINDDVTEIIKNYATPYNPRTQENIEGYREEGIAAGKIGQWMQHPRISPHYGGSGVVTTVNDLLKWSENFITKKFGGEAFYNLMHRTETFAHGRNNQAFGLYFDKYKERKSVAWDGGDFGVSAQLIRFPDQQVAIVVLSNLGSGMSYRKANAIAEVLIGERIL